jgi:hypothetical protein
MGMGEKNAKIFPASLFDNQFIEIAHTRTGIENYRLPAGKDHLDACCVSAVLDSGRPRRWTHSPGAPPRHEFSFRHLKGKHRPFPAMEYQRVSPHWHHLAHLD